MPIYEYVCSSCNDEIETIQKVSDTPLTKCPNCQTDTLSKKTSMTSFQLKGGGWYSDGYGNGKTESETKNVATKNNKKAIKNSTETKTETKTKAETKGKSAGQSKAS
jgi:putative FmdB family regulatory protein